MTFCQLASGNTARQLEPKSDNLCDDVAIVFVTTNYKNVLLAHCFVCLDLLCNYTLSCTHSNSFWGNSYETTNLSFAIVRISVNSQSQANIQSKFLLAKFIRGNRKEITQIDFFFKFLVHGHAHHYVLVIPHAYHVICVYP